jgi:hypothetical protein
MFEGISTIGVGSFGELAAECCVFSRNTDAVVHAKRFVFNL